MNYKETGCKAKCPTCPKALSGPMSGAGDDLLFKALRSIKEKFKDDNTSFSLQNEISDLPTVLEGFSFDLTGVEYIGCGIKLPFDVTTVTSVFNYFGSNMPNVMFALFLENRGCLPDYKKDVCKLIKIFLASNVSKLGITCHNNSMRVNVFDRKIDEMVMNTRTLFREILKIYATDNFNYYSEEGSIPMTPKNYKSLYNYLRLNVSGKEILVTERILGFEKNTQDSNNLITFYRNHFIEELQRKNFTVEKMVLAFTPLGVRVNHRSFDIQNPYLWLSYEEYFEALEDASSLEDFCLILEFLMKKTEYVSCAIQEITYDTVQILAEARKN